MNSSELQERNCSTLTAVHHACKMFTCALVLPEICASDGHILALTQSCSHASSVVFMCLMMQTVQGNANTMARVGAEDKADQRHLEWIGTNVIADVGAAMWACGCGCGRGGRGEDRWRALLRYAKPGREPMARTRGTPLKSRMRGRMRSPTVTLAASSEGPRGCCTCSKQIELWWYQLLR